MRGVRSLRLLLSQVDPAELWARGNLLSPSYEFSQHSFNNLGLLCCQVRGLPWVGGEVIQLNRWGIRSNLTINHIAIDQPCELLRGSSTEEMVANPLALEAAFILGRDQHPVTLSKGKVAGTVG